MNGVVEAEDPLLEVVSFPEFASDDTVAFRSLAQTQLNL